MTNAALHVDHPVDGYYKTRAHRDGPWLPVAIWTKADGTQVCRVASGMRDPLDVWPYCANNKVEKADAKHAFEHGRWPNDAPDVGHNSTDLSLAEQIKDYAVMALEWLGKFGVKDADSKDKAANMRQELLNLRKRADTEREAEKRPHLEASRAVDAQFKPLIDDADAAANKLRDALTVYMREEETKARAEAEAKRKAEEARLTAERKRIETKRAKLMQDDPIAALTSPEPELPELPLAAEPVKIQAGGQRGRKTGLRTVTRYEVRDYEAALAAVKDHPDVIAAVEKVAAARAKTGVAVPGVEKIEEKVAA